VTRTGKQSDWSGGGTEGLDFKLAADDPVKIIRLCSDRDNVF